jgi:hypothetical protein
MIVIIVYEEAPKIQCIDSTVIYFKLAEKIIYYNFKI